MTRCRPRASARARSACRSGWKIPTISSTTSSGRCARRRRPDMELTVNGARTFCYTGGKPFDPAKPTAVFVHGVLNDHSVWILQTRYFAHHGWNVLAPDLPGHCRSEGEPPRSVEEAAAFVLGLLDAAGIDKAALVGHSFGSLTAMEAASRAPGRVTHLAMVGTAYPMKVS